jgi:tRNA-Thr(GGU) m(6)t(6)A37 methyltransferase TsaA
MNDGTSGADSIELRPVGRVSSTLVDPEAAPLQGDEGAPDASLVFNTGMRAALADLDRGSEVLVLTWLHQADRDVLAVHPRGDLSRPKQGVFTTRSQDRPNPIGLHRVRIVGIDGLSVRVENLEAVDGTPVLDIKPLLGGSDER